MRKQVTKQDITPDQDSSAEMGHLCDAEKAESVTWDRDTSVRTQVLRLLLSSPYKSQPHKVGFGLGLSFGGGGLFFALGGV